MGRNQHMTVPYVTVTIPNGIFGSSQQYKNHDPKRIQHVEIISDEVHLYMTKEHREQAIAEFESYLTLFQQQVDIGEIELLYGAYERIDYDEHYRIIRCYVTAEHYFNCGFLAINETEIVIDAMYYQLYKGLTPSVTFEYIDIETNAQLGQMQYP